MLVTGASTGIGRATALRLSHNGYRVYAGVRKPEGGERLQAEASGELYPVQLDVTVQTDVDKVAARLEAELGAAGLYGLVNNAGIAVTAPLEHLPLDALRQQFEVNVFGVLSVTQACLPLLRRTKGRIKGRTVMVSSVSGRVGLPLVGAYCASKFALEGLSDALRRELAPWGLPVSVVQPGQIATPIWQKSQRRADELAASMPPEAGEHYSEAIAKLRNQVERGGTKGISPERVAAVVAKALASQRPRPRYAVGVDSRLGLALARLLPDRLLDWLIRRLT